MDKGILFSIRNYAGLGVEIARLGGLQTGEVETQIWPDGEIYQRVRTQVAGRDAFLVAGTGTETDTLEAFDLASALVQQGALSLSVVIPFFGYSTMERAWQPGEAVTAKSRARIWCALPSAPLGNRIFILEPHTPSLPHFFEGQALVIGLEAQSLMLKILARLAVESPVLCSPDIGRIKWVDSLASASGRQSAFVLKRRVEDGSIQTFGLSGKVAGCEVVLCDDMIRTGGTLLNAARACLEAGATGVSAVAIHGAFSPGTLEKLRESRLLDALACTDSHPFAHGEDSAWPAIFGCAEVLAKALPRSDSTPS